MKISVRITPCIMEVNNPFMSRGFADNKNISLRAKLQRQLHMIRMTLLSFAYRGSDRRTCYDRKPP